MHIIFYKSTSVLRSLLVPFFRGIHNYSNFDGLNSSGPLVRGQPMDEFERYLD